MPCPNRRLLPSLVKLSGNSLQGNDMKTLTTLSGFLAGMLTAGTLFAQAPTPAEPAAQPSDPSAASSPHQRATTKSPSEQATPSTGAKASDAASPHQKQTLKKKHKKKVTPPSS